MCWSCIFSHALAASFILPRRACRTVPAVLHLRLCHLSRATLNKMITMFECEVAKEALNRNLDMNKSGAHNVVHLRNLYTIRDILLLL
mmetsp:Transcript_97/g.119  ORF Transcript_97/g.119 Transcript_97/m.119 type:complete len:88 (+) Transcript_97:53-316(+)